MKEALLVIDVDLRNGWHDEIAPHVPRYSVERATVAQSIFKTVEEWRSSQKPIIFVALTGDFLPAETKHQLHMKKGPCLVCDPRSDCHIPKFLNHRHDPYEPVFLKGSNNAFTNPNLAKFLKKKGVERLVLTGCFTFMCVRDTARGGLANGFRVALLEQATYPQFDKELRKDRWVSSVRSWQNDPHDPKLIEVI